MVVRIVLPDNLGKARAMKILLVDDDRENLESLSEALELFGYSTDQFIDPQQAVQAYACNNYDMVITDYKMAVIDGLQLLCLLRQIDPQARVILVSGYLTNDIFAQAKENGALACFPKPLEFEAILHILQGEPLPNSDCR